MTAPYAITCKMIVWALLVQEPTVRTAINLVLIPVSVRDQRGRFVYDLSPSDFTVFDNGLPRDVRVDTPDSVIIPVRVVVMVQTNDIADSALLKIKKVGTMIEDSVAGANGSTAVITYADQIKVVRAFGERETDLSTIFAGLRSVKSRKSRMLDAVSKALDLLQAESKPSRDVLLIIGESKDRGSEKNLPDLLPALQRSGATICSLAYSAYLTPLTTKASDYSAPEAGRGWIVDSITEAIHATHEDSCRILVASTGGEQLKFETKAKLEDDLIRLGGFIHSRYLISLVIPGNEQSGFHRLDIQVKGASQFHIEARPGYWMTAESKM